MKWREQNAPVHRVQMHKALQLEIHRVMSLTAVARTVAREQILSTTAETRDVPGNIELGDRFLNPGGPPLGEGNHMIKSLLSEDFFQGGAHGCE